MNDRPKRGVLVFSLALFLAATVTVGQEGAVENPTAEEAPTTMRAQGSCEDQLGPLQTYNQAADAKVGRMSIDKTFAGDLVATSRGEMLTGGSPARARPGMSPSSA